MSDRSNRVYQTNYEAQFQKMLASMLRREGHHPYRDALSDFKVNLTDDPNITAAIDARRGVIYINNKFADGDADDLKVLSMLIRHELLHAFLNHYGRGLNHIAYKLGLDPHNLRKIDFEKINSLMFKGNVAYPEYGNPHTGNIAGDYDLSRYYNPEDKEVTETLGGLLLDDRPDWLDLSFEEMHDILEEEHKVMEQRLMPKVYGSFDPETGEFTTEYEVKNDFDRDTIDAQDMGSFKLMSKAEMEKCFDNLYSALGEVVTWISDLPEDVGKKSIGIKNDVHACVHYWRTVDTAPVTAAYSVYVKVGIRHLPLYGFEEGEKVLIMTDSGDSIEAFIYNRNSVIIRLPKTVFDKDGMTNDPEKASIHTYIKNYISDFKGK